MMQRKTRWIAVTLVVLAVLAAGSLAGYDTAVAAPCCSSCESGYDNCFIGCNGDPVCEAGCDARWENCFRWCVWSC